MSGLQSNFLRLRPTGVDESKAFSLVDLEPQFKSEGWVVRNGNEEGWSALEDDFRTFVQQAVG